MNVEIKWENLDANKYFNDKLIDLVKKYQNNDKLSAFNFIVSREPNSRHLINLMVNTKNEGEQLKIVSNSFNLDNSLYLLKKELKKTINKYDQKEYLLKKEKEKKLAAEAIERAEKAIEKKLKEKLDAEKEAHDKRSALERENLVKEEKRNAAILKKLEKRRKKLQEEDSELLAELEKQRKEVEEAKKIQEENQQRLREHMATLKFDVVADDLEEDREIQEKIKEDKQKLKSLQAEENECLVIIEEIKEVERKEFDVDEFVVNEPFILGDCWFYYDEKNNIYKANEEGGWDPISKQEVQPYYDETKRPILEELELRLIEARKRRKLHLKDMADGRELIAELEASAGRRKRLEKERKEKFKSLKQNYEEFHNKTAEELKAHIKPVDIEIAETHPANEPFLSENNQWAYHDGEGKYYIADEYGNWVETNKNSIYNKSTIATTSIEPSHEAGETFKNSNGDTIYFDGEIYYKLVNNEWVKTTYAEANDLGQNHNRRKKKETKAIKNSTKAIDSESDIGVEEDNTDSQVSQNSNITTNGDGSTQWQDENGTWWYLDANGNYYYSDGTNWIPYTYQ